MRTTVASRSDRRHRTLACSIVALALATIPLATLATSAAAHETPAYWHESGIPAANPDWMGTLLAKDHTRKLSSLSIPGTHDSGTYPGNLINGGDLARAQSMPIAAQLEAGIRAFDIRLGHYTQNLTPPALPTELAPLQPALDALVAAVNDVGSSLCRGPELYVFHNFFCMEVTFTSILHDMGDFLNAHPGEALLLRITAQEPPSWADSDKDQTTNPFPSYVNAALTNFDTTYPNRIYPGKTCAGGTNAGAACTVDSECPGSTCTQDSNPTLKAIHGRLVILDDSYGTSTYPAWPGSLKYGDLDRGDAYDVGTEWDLASKWNGAGTTGCTDPPDGTGPPDDCNNIVYQLLRINDGANHASLTDKVIVTFTSTSSHFAIPMPYFWASGHALPGTADDRLWTGWTRGSLGTCGSANKCLPEWYYPSLSCTESQVFDTRTCSVYFEGLNVLTMHYINNNEQTALGESNAWGLPVRLQRTGILFSDFPGAGLISAVTLVNYRQYTGDHDVGVIAGKDGCATPESTVLIRTDDEDDHNANNSFGWLGATTSDQYGTEFTFCRVDPTAANLRPLAGPTGSPRYADYAVLKLGAECPPGSREFQRFLENERDDNGSFIIGDAWPNRQNWSGQGVGTLLSFCEFEPEFALEDGAPTMTAFPPLAEAPFGYGVFAHPIFPKALKHGGLHIDDEDFDNADGYANLNQCASAFMVGGCNTPGCTIATGGAFDGTDANTDMWLAKVVGVCGDGDVDPGEVCDDGNTYGGDCCSADCKTLKPVQAACTNQYSLCQLKAECEDNPLLGRICIPTLGAANGTPCDDGDACTVNDTCSGTMCQGEPKECVPPNQCQLSAGCQSGACVYVDKADGTPCDDGDICTTGDVCSNGVCVGTVKCPAQAQDGCHKGQCDPKIGNCGPDTTMPDGTPCDDGDPGTRNDVCTAGTCAGTVVSAGAACDALTPDDCHTDVCVCDPVTGCTLTAKANGTPCGDVGTCTASTCQDGVCTGTPVQDGTPCDDREPCTQGDVCNAGACVGTAQPDGTSCDDGDPCTRNDVCTAGRCAGTVIPAGAACDAPAPDDCHMGVCDPVTGCTLTAVQDGTSCDDGNPCTSGDTCRGGACSGTPVSCDDENPCTDDHCDGTGGAPLCVHENNGKCIGPHCGNGVVDAADGETCDPPNLTINPTTGQPYCRLDCTACGDGVVQANDQETCDDGNIVSGCDPVHPQKALDACQNTCTPPICADPSRITVNAGRARLYFHGRLTSTNNVDAGSLDPTDKMFVVQLTKPDGTVVFRSSLLAGSIQRSGDRFDFKNRAAGSTDGVQSLRLEPVRGAYRATLVAYCDLGASQANMTTAIFVGDQEWTVQGEWQAMNGGWRLTPKGTVAR
jgi:cysteine-rich repeat protein